MELDDRLDLSNDDGLDLSNIEQTSVAEDLSTRAMTPADLANLTNWYERAIGYVPDSIRFRAEVPPGIRDVNRAKWEVAIKTLPKQIVPYLMLRHHTITGLKDGLREAALLAKAWNVTPGLVIQAIAGTAMYFTGFEGRYAAYASVDDLLESW